MKYLLLLSMLLVGCGIGAEDLTYQIPDENPQEAPEEPEEEPAPELDLELTFNVQKSTFEEIVVLNEKCSDETYLEDNSTDIVIAEVIQSGDQSTLQVMDWIKGTPAESSGEISFFNGISTAPEFEEGKSYKIYLHKTAEGSRDPYQVTCYSEGVVEVTLID